MWLRACRAAAKRVPSLLVRRADPRSSSWRCCCCSPDSPRRRGMRLVDEAGTPMTAASVEEGTFYTAFPEGADREEIGSPVVVVRVPPSQLRLPAQRAGWAPFGILAYSKICTHAGCAVAL